MPGTAWAGHYEVAYAGGTATDETGSYPHQDQAGGYWGRNAGYVSGSARANARASCTGQITATFTWTKDNVNDLEPPPTKAIVYEESSATTQGSGSGTANNGLTGTSGLAKRYTIQNNPGSIFYVYCTPTATMGPFPYGVATASVSYRASAQPLEVILAGGIGPKDNKRYLMGQQVTATLNNGGLAPTYSWSASGGAPFKSWTATQNSTTPGTTQPSLGTETGNSFEFYFKAPTAGGTQATVTCQVNLSVPSGALPVGGFANVSITRDCTVARPEEISFKAYTPQNTSQYPGPGSIALPDHPANGVGLYDLPNPGALGFHGVSAPGSPNGDDVGIRWDGTVRTTTFSPNPWGGNRGWHFVQKVKGNRYRVNSGTREANAENGLDLLDGSYPYEPEPYDPASNSPGTWDADGITHVAGDAPEVGIPATLTEVEANEHFDTWMMYRPPGSGSVFVPLKKIKWSWNGKAQRSGGVWSMLYSDSGWQLDGDFPLFPLWMERSGPFLNTWNPAP